LQKRIDEARVNEMLMSNGLGKLDDPGLIPQLGFLVSHIVRTHEHFRDLVNKCEPSKRPALYESMKPYIRFELKPLDVYIAELADLAERKQLPTVNPDGTLSEFKVPEIRSNNDGDEPAVLSEAKTPEEQAAQAGAEGAVAEKFLELTCRSCTFYEVFAGWNKQTCINKARVAGWRAVHSEARGEDAELCPACIARYWPSLR